MCYLVKTVNMSIKNVTFNLMLTLIFIPMCNRGFLGKRDIECKGEQRIKTSRVV